MKASLEKVKYFHRSKCRSSGITRFGNGITCVGTPGFPALPSQYYPRYSKSRPYRPNSDK